MTEPLMVNGKRYDGRTLDQFRPIEMNLNVVKNAKGSATFRFGSTHALAAVYGPKPFFPKGLQDPQRAILKFRYTMVPFSTTERSRPGTSRRNTEISMVLANVFRNVIFLEEFPKAGIEIFVDILQAEASTRCAALNAASAALAIAGVPMRDLPACCSVGRVDKQLVLDVAGKEDTEGDVDMPVATVGGEDRIVLLQMDGIITKEEFEKLLKMGVSGCKELHGFIKKTLEENYVVGEINEG